MRIPVYDQQQVASEQVGLPAYAPHPASDAGLRAGLEHLGQGIDQLGARAQHEEEKAIAAETTDAETNFTRRVTGEIHGDSATGKTGFMALQGRAAEADGAPVMERIQKHREDIANGLKDDRAKKLFLERTGRQVENVRGSVESFVSTQRRVADQSTLKARADAASEAMFQAARQGDGATVQLQSQALEGPIRALALSPEDAERDVALWRRQTVATQLDGFLAPSDVEERAGVLGQTRDPRRLEVAEQLFTDARDQLGPELSKKYAAAIDIAKKKVGGDDLALELVNGARQENGFVDEAMAIEALQAVPKEKRTPEVEQAFSKWMQLENMKRKAVVEQHFDRALSSYLGRHQLGDIAPLDELWLRNPKNDPEGWYRLEQIAKSHREGGPASAAQSRAMTEFLVDVADHPDKYATMKIEEFNHTWLPRLARNDAERAGVVLAQQHANAGKPGKLGALETNMLLQKGRDAGVFDPKQRDVSKWSDEQAENFYRAEQILSERVAAEKRATGKEPDIEKVKGWVDEMLLGGKDPERGFMGFGGGTTRLEAETKGTAFVPKWTDEQKRKAVDQLKKLGARTDEDAIDTLLRKVYGLPAAPTQAAPAKPPTEVDPGRWGLDLTPEPAADENIAPMPF